MTAGRIRGSWFDAKAVRGNRLSDLADFGMDLAVPVAWAGCLGAGGSFSGTVTAFMNTRVDHLGSRISPLAASGCSPDLGRFRSHAHERGAVYLIASLLWLKVDPTRSFHASPRWFAPRVCSRSK